MSVVAGGGAHVQSHSAGGAIGPLRVVNAVEGAVLGQFGAAAPPAMVISTIGPIQPGGASGSHV
jgi:hypothetical protein